MMSSLRKSACHQIINMLFGSTLWRQLTFPPFLKSSISRNIIFKIFLSLSRYGWMERIAPTLEENFLYEMAVGFDFRYE